MADAGVHSFISFLGQSKYIRVPAGHGALWTVGCQPCDGHLDPSNVNVKRLGIPGSMDDFRGF